MNLTQQDVQEILQLLDASLFDELELETDRFKLTLRRSGAGGWTQETHTTAVARVMTASEKAPVPAESPSTSPPPTSSPLLSIRTPIIGTFYRAPKPGAAPFVEIGTEVSPDTVVGIVETMKLMNSVYAGTHGRVVEICQGDGDFVEHGQVLMRLDPEHP